MADGTVLSLSTQAIGWAASAYSIVRALSWQLKVAPFSFPDLLAALCLPQPGPIVDDLHVAVLRYVLHGVCWCLWCVLVCVVGLVCCGVGVFVYRPFVPHVIHHTSSSSSSSCTITTIMHHYHHHHPHHTHHTPSSSHFLTHPGCSLLMSQQQSVHSVCWTSPT